MRPPTETAKGMELAKKFAEEDKALGGMEADTLIKTDARFD